jgi:hypothetical protein
VVASPGAYPKTTLDFYPHLPQREHFPFFVFLLE